MLKNRLSTPEMNRKLASAIREAIASQYAGTIKIMDVQVSSTELQPAGFSFSLKVNGMVVPVEKENPPA